MINIVPTADRQKATVRVRIAFDELDPRILPDMGVKVSFLEDRGDAAGAARAAVRVPSAAVLRDGETSYVWRIIDGRSSASRCVRAVSATVRSSSSPAVNAGDVVVAAPAEGLVEGASVRTKSG